MSKRLLENVDGYMSVFWSASIGFHYLNIICCFFVQLAEASMGEALNAPDVVDDANSGVNNPNEQLGQVCLSV